jgi:WD40 repeat protein
MLILQLTRRQPVHTLAFSPDGRTLASVAGRSPVVQFWDIEQRQQTDETDGNNGRVVSAAFSHDGEWFALATSVGELCLWLFGSLKRCGYSFRWRREAAHAPAQLVFAPNGRGLATNLCNEFGPVFFPSLHQYQDYNSIHIFPDCEGEPSPVPLRTGHLGEVTCLAYTPDGNRLAVGSFDRTVAVWDVASKARLLHLVHGQKVHYLAFSPDGQTLAAGNPQGLVKVWDMTTGRKRGTLKGQARPLRSLCYSPDGRVIATAGGEGIVTFWDVASGGKLTSFDWGIGAVQAVAFAPDGMRAAAAGVGQIVLWDIDWDL